MKILPMLLTLAVSAQALIGQESFRGPLPEQQRELIRQLAENHKELKRTVTLTETGYTATTTSTNSTLAQALKDHVAYMEKRLDSGAMVRRWDPAFAELVKHYSDLSAEIKILPDGLAVNVSGKNPDSIKVAQNHAKIVSGFVDEGSEAVSRTHPPALKK
jgi:hypothetical protein